MSPFHPQNRCDVLCQFVFLFVHPNVASETKPLVTQTDGLCPSYGLP